MRRIPGAQLFGFGRTAATPTDEAEPANPGQIGTPREANIIERYLPDPSLRYFKTPPAGTQVTRALKLAAIGAIAVATCVGGIARATLDSGVRFALALSVAIVSAAIVILAIRPLYRAIRDLGNRLFFRLRCRTIELGLDRAVFQPDGTFRYEVHIHCRADIDVRELMIRLVFWESWTEATSIRMLNMTRLKRKKHGHDLARHSAQGLVMGKNQHAVVRGEMRVPAQRPSEHYRGLRKHLSYVNVTATIIGSVPKGPRTMRADCPLLITFPWM